MNKPRPWSSPRCHDFYLLLFILLVFASLSSFAAWRRPSSTLAFRAEIPETVVYETTVDRDKGIHLITTFFKGTYAPARVREIVECLRKNVENPALDAVHVLWEDVDPREELTKTNVRDLLGRKLITTRTSKQPTYLELFTYVNENLLRGSIAIVTNSDIYFDKHVGKLTFKSPSNDSEWHSAMVLSRSPAPECGGKPDWNGIFDLCKTYIGSHDAMVFAPPVPSFVLKNSNHVQNVFGGENRIVFGFMHALGYKGHVSNPCKQITAYHMHCVQERHYQIGKFVSGNQATVRPGAVVDYPWNYIH